MIVLRRVLGVALAGTAVWLLWVRAQVSGPAASAVAGVALAGLVAALGLRSAVSRTGGRRAAAAASVAVGGKGKARQSTRARSGAAGRNAQARGQKGSAGLAEDPPTEGKAPRSKVRSRQGRTTRGAAREPTNGHKMPAQHAGAGAEPDRAVPPAGETPLRIPFGNKEAALQLGTRYRAGGWYAPLGVSLGAFRERGWL